VCLLVIYESACLLFVCLHVCYLCVCMSVICVSACLLFVCLHVCYLCVCLSVICVSDCLLFVCMMYVICVYACMLFVCLHMCYLCVCMSIIRQISSVSRYVSCLCLICMYSHCKQLRCGEVFVEGWNFGMKVRLQVTAGNVKICSYFHIGNNPCQKGFS
jgi:hypothetical protein